MLRAPRATAATRRRTPHHRERTLGSSVGEDVTGDKVSGTPGGGGGAQKESARYFGSSGRREPVHEESAGKQQPLPLITSNSAQLLLAASAMAMHACMHCCWLKPHKRQPLVPPPPVSSFQFQWGSVLKPSTLLPLRTSTVDPSNPAWPGCVNPHQWSPAAFTRS